MKLLFKIFRGRSWTPLVRGLLRPIEVVIMIVWMKRTLREARKDVGRV